jgi:geranylgeranyl pyrophosphate synthase
MWQEKQVELLRREIGTVLAPVSTVAGLHELVEEPLTKTRRGLSVEGAYDKPWPLLPLIVCEAISGHYKHILPAAAALQLLITAGDVFDDIEDTDYPQSLADKYGPAVATNVATTLLILAEKAITRLKTRGVAEYMIVRVINVVNSFYVTACAGQHLDLTLSSKMDISEDEYVKITGMKSASQVECACHIGALLAMANQELINTFTVFGYNLGMAAQITNDIHGITQGTDILKRKISLPIIYALAQTNGKVYDQLELAFGKLSESVSDPTQIRDLLFHCGAVHYATIKMEHYKQRARDIISEVEGAGISIGHLNLFLE